MSNSDSTKNWEHGLGVPVEYASSALLEKKNEKWIRGKKIICL